MFVVVAAKRARHTLAEFPDLPKELHPDKNDLDRSQVKLTYQVSAHRPGGRRSQSSSSVQLSYTTECLFEFLIVQLRETR